MERGLPPAENIDVTELNIVHSSVYMEFLVPVNNGAHWLCLQYLSCYWPPLSQRWDYSVIGQHGLYDALAIGYLEKTPREDIRRQKTRWRKVLY